MNLKKLFTFKSQYGKFSEKYTYKNNKLKFELKLRNFEVHLVEHCNLNCKGCNHFSPLANEEIVDIEVFKKDFKRLSELTNKDVEYIHLLGGEPLLAPNIVEFIKIARHFFPKTKINIVTNGILLDSFEDDFYKILSKYKIHISITKYPLNINWKEISKRLDKFKVKFELWGDEYHDTVKHSWYFPLDLEGKQNYKYNFEHCYEGFNCIFLREGKLYPCPIPGNIYHFNKYFNKSIEVTNDDFIDIYKANNISEIINFLSNPIPFCRYCNLSARKFNLKWEISNKDISEWVYND